MSLLEVDRRFNLTIRSSWNLHDLARSALPAPEKLNSPRRSLDIQSPPFLVDNKPSRDAVIKLTAFVGGSQIHVHMLPHPTLQVELRSVRDALSARLAESSLAGSGFIFRSSLLTMRPEIQTPRQAPDRTATIKPPSYLITQFLKS